MTNYIGAFIFARGGSKGVPRKNIRMIAGKPLIAYSIHVAFASELIDRVFVSTEDPEIASIAVQYGAEVPFLRPSELAADDSPELLSWKHAVREVSSLFSSQSLRVFVSVPPTAPLRSTDDIDACIRLLLSSNADLVITVKPAERNPFFNMVRIDEDDWAHPIFSGDQAIHRRQDAPALYDMTTVAYAARPGFVLETESLFAGKVKAHLVPRERALDIDSELDLEIAEFLLQKGLNQ